MHASHKIKKEKKSLSIQLTCLRFFLFSFLICQCLLKTLGNTDAVDFHSHS